MKTKLGGRTSHATKGCTISVSSYDLSNFDVSDFKLLDYTVVGHPVGKKELTKLSNAKIDEAQELEKEYDSLTCETALLLESLND